MIKYYLVFKSTIKFSVLVLLGFFFWNLEVFAGEQLEILDSFKNGKEGEILYKQKTEVGDVKWEASLNLTYTIKEENSFIISNSDAVAVAQIPVSFQNGTIRMSALLNPGEHATNRWAGLALQNVKDKEIMDGADPEAASQFCVILYSNGNADVFELGRRLKLGYAPGFKWAEFNRVDLSYTFETKTLTVMINGKEFLSCESQIVPVIHWARLELQNPHPLLSGFDDVSIVVEPAQ
jgi:hypothetical protein